MAKSALIWAVKQRGLQPNAKLVLLQLADHARAADWKSWPGVDLLVVETGLSRRSIYDQLNRLEKDGLIKRVESCDRKRVFKLNRAVDNFSSSANHDNRVVQISTLSSANKSTSSANGDNVLLLREPIEPFLNQKKPSKKVNRPTVDKPRGDQHERSASGQAEAAEERVRERYRRSRDRPTVGSNDADLRPSLDDQSRRFDNSVRGAVGHREGLADGPEQHDPGADRRRVQSSPEGPKQVAAFTAGIYRAVLEPPDGSDQSNGLPEATAQTSCASIKS